MNTAIEPNGRSNPKPEPSGSMVEIEYSEAASGDNEE